MRHIDADDLKEKLKSESYWTYTHEFGDAIPVGWVMSAIDNAPTVNLENRIRELFNTYDILLLHRDGKIVPIKNSTKQDCYNLLYEIQELIEWRKILFNKHLSEVQNENND